MNQPKIYLLFGSQRGVGVRSRQVEVGERVRVNIKTGLNQITAALMLA
jgi:hypothetical protein